MEEKEGEVSDATLTYEQADDSELTVDYEQEESVKDEAKRVEKELTVHSAVEEKEKEVVKSKKRKLEDSSELPPSAKRTLSCAKKEVVMAEGKKELKDQQGKDGKETIDEGSESVNVKSAGAAATKPSLEKKDSMEENLICQICQV